jgi:nicotinate-nucleotide pyrophosphorylase (carboxylating)
MRAPFGLPDVDAVIAAALAEDLGVSPATLLTATPGLLDADVTGALLAAAARFQGVMRMRSAGVVCGLPVAQRVWQLLAAAAEVEAPECFPLVAEGAAVDPGRAVLDVTGDARVVLAGERTALDFVMVLSGIATRAAEWQAAAGPSVEVTDTRKTVPGLRALSKYAVAVGGASNHRMGLFDMVLIKDNHIAASGDVASAIARSRELHPSLLVEVEADTVEQAARAAASGADMVLLDNMDDAMLADAVTAVRQATPAGRACLTEASGGITLERLATLAATGVDRVSASALTLAPPLDVGLDEGRDG